MVETMKRTPWCYQALSAEVPTLKIYSIRFIQGQGSSFKGIVLPIGLGGKHCFVYV